MSSQSSSLRPLPGRGGSSNRQQQRRSAKPPSPRREATSSSSSSSSSYESKRLDLVKAVQSSLKQLYAAGYTRARATSALVEAIERRVPVLLLPRSDPPPASSRSAPPPVSGMPWPLPTPNPCDDDDVLSAMRRHRIGDGSARHVLVVAQWVGLRTQELLEVQQNTCPRGGGGAEAPDREAEAMARAVDELTQLVRDAPRSILARRAQPGASVPRLSTPSKVVPVVRAPSAADSPLLLRSPSPPSTTQERPPRAPPTQNNKKPKVESASLLPPRARSDSAVDAERTISSKLRSAPAAAASAASADSASSSEAGANPGMASSSTRKRLRSGTVVNKSNGVAAVDSIHSRGNSSNDAEGSGDGSTGGGTSSKSVPSPQPPNAIVGKRTRTRR